MCERLIIMHLLICFFYLLQINIISLTSPKITLVLCLLFAFCKNNFYFILRKTSPTRTGAARLFPPALHVVINPVQITEFFNILVHNPQTITWLFFTSPDSLTSNCELSPPCINWLSLLQSRRINIHITFS